MGLPIPQAITRDILVAGGEREPAGIVIGGGLGMLAMAWQFWSLPSLILGIFLLTSGLYAVRRIAKEDPKMFKVYRRYLTYRAYYPAHSTPFRVRRFGCGG